MFFNKARKRYTSPVFTVIVIDTREHGWAPAFKVLSENFENRVSEHIRDLQCGNLKQFSVGQPCCELSYRTS